MLSHPAAKVGAILATIATALGQVPAHAVALNPSGAILTPVVMGRSGDVVHAFGVSLTTMFDGPIRYARSDDGGLTWPVRERPLGAMGDVRAVAVDGPRVVVLASHYFTGPHVLRSVDGGATWSAPVPVSANPTVGMSRSIPLAMHVDGNTVNVVWMNPTGYNEPVFANRSLDGGATWQPADTQLVGPTLQWQSGPMLRLVGSGAALHVFWSFAQTTPGPTPTLYQRSLDGGQTWLAAPQTLLSGPFSDATAVGSTVLVADPATLLRSTDAGTTWLPVVGLGIPMLTSLAAAGMRAIAVGRAVPAAPLAYFVNVSLDGGATWRSAPFVLPTYGVFRTAAHATDADFLVHFVDVNTAPSLVIQSHDAGANWRAWNGPSEVGFWPADDGVVLVTKSATQWLAYLAAGHSPRGTGTAGTGGSVPRLAGAGLPTLGRTTTLAVTEARGGSFGLLGLSFAPAAPTPLGSAVLWLQGAVSTLGLPTSGAAGQPAAGTFSLALAIPATPTLIGRRFTTQAFVLDPVAADGFTATNALESWVR